MDMKRIDEAIARYTQDAAPDEVARLAFFRGLWQIQEDEAQRLGALRTYEQADDEKLEEQYWSGTPALLANPVDIEPTEFAETCRKIAAYLADNAGLADGAAKVLRAYDWGSFTQQADIAEAGKDPAQFVENCLRSFDGFGVDAACPASIFMMVPSFAIRSHLQGPAAQVAARLRKPVADDKLYHDKPLRCPVCGSPASASSVASGTDIESHDRQLYCGLCGTQWEFERIRCACCGSRNAGKLHWFHIEGDSAHRLQNCEECGDYMRTVFQDDLGAFACMEVEDVKMALLDHVALRAGNQDS